MRHQPGPRRHRQKYSASCDSQVQVNISNAASVGRGGDPRRDTAPFLTTRRQLGHEEKSENPQSNLAFS